MMQRLFNRSVFLILPALLGLELPAQLQSVVGPVAAPVGCSIHVSFSNDTAERYIHGECPFTVRDGNGTVIFPGFCSQIGLITLPGETFATTWPQIDQFGNQVVPGQYSIDVDLPNGVTQTHVVRIDPAVRVALTPLGVPRLGTTRNYGLCASGEGGSAYLLLASLSANTGIPTCGGVFPLDPSPLMFAATFGVAPFVNFFGMLDANGETTSPALALPPRPALSGLPLHLAFFVPDVTQPCPVRSISPPLIFLLR